MNFVHPWKFFQNLLRCRDIVFTFFPIYHVVKNNIILLNLWQLIFLPSFVKFEWNRSKCVCIAFPILNILYIEKITKGNNAAKVAQVKPKILSFIIIYMSRLFICKSLGRICQSVRKAASEFIYLLQHADISHLLLPYHFVGYINILKHNYSAFQKKLNNIQTIN